MSKPFAVTDGTFEAEVLQADKPVLTDFWAEWCGPCHAIAPVLEEIAEEYDGQMKVAKLDVGSNSVIATEYGVMYIPTLILFVDGKPVERLVGAMTKSSLVDRLASHL
jgi:thioredoxin 1